MIEPWLDFLYFLQIDEKGAMNPQKRVSADFFLERTERLVNDVGHIFCIDGRFAVLDSDRNDFRDLQYIDPLVHLETDEEASRTEQTLMVHFIKANKLVRMKEEIGMSRKPPMFLRAGNNVRLSVEGLGEQQQRFVADEA